MYTDASLATTRANVQLVHYISVVVGYRVLLIWLLRVQRDGTAGLMLLLTYTTFSVYKCN